MNNKEKRRRQSTSETNNSFMKNVTSRVSGFLPATITKWFSSPRSSDANGSTPTADATDSSTEDEDPESPVTAQPPAKRMRYGSPGKHSSQSSVVYTENNSITTNIEIIETQNTYSPIQSPPGRNTFRKETNFISTPIQSPNDESNTETTEKDNTSLKSQHTVSAIGQSVAAKRKSIFNTPINKEESLKACAKTSNNTMKDPNQPCFKPSLFGSPFYPGRTMYGGAASSYINQANVKQRKVTVVNEAQTNDNCAMSQSAKRIMDLLEHYSSPIMEARRIPNIPRNSIHDSLYTTSTDSLSRSADKVLSYKTQELHVPNMASILRLKKKSRLMDTTNAARQLIASYSSASDYQPYISSSPKREQTETEPSHKATTKVKSRLTRPCRGDNHNDLFIPVKLPTGVLQIEKDNLPKFTFESSGVSKFASSTPAFTMSKSTSPDYESTFTKRAQASTCTVTSISSNSIFKFSNPVPVPYETPQTCTPPKFCFGSPERGIDKTEVKKKLDDPSIVVGEIEESEKSVESNDWKCSECWVVNKVSEGKCACCGHKKPAVNTEKPLNDTCVNSEKIEMPMNNISKLPPTKTAGLSNWKCQDCWVNNDDNVDKCACCGSRKSLTTGSVDVPQNITDSDWKCDDCWVTNRGSVEKCAACGGSKTGAKKVTNSTQSFGTVKSSLFKSADNKLTNIVMAQKSGNRWECTSCLVRNESDKTICICCGMDRESIEKVENKSFNFGMNTNTTFKFGINNVDVQGSTLPKTDLMFTDSKKIEESETNNNVLPKPPTFTFTLPVKKPDDQITSAKEKTVETPKMNFIFGIPKKDSTDKFSTNKLPESDKKVPAEIEKLQEVPKVDLTSQPLEKPKMLTGFFNTPLTLKPAQDKPSTVVSSVSESAMSKETPSAPLREQSSIESVQQQNTFSFSPSGSKSSMNLFASPISTTATAGISLTSPLQSAPKTTASVMSVFQKPESRPRSSLSFFKKSDCTATSSTTIFQKKESVATIAPTASTTAVAPIFSFGGNAAQVQSTAPAPAPAPVPAPAAAPEKPKFNFTFGSSTETSLFKPSFGAVDNAAASNKFSLPTGTLVNQIGSGITLSGNPQGGNNGLPPITTLAGTSALGGSGPATGKPLGGSELSNNTTLPTGNALTTGKVLGSGSSGILFGTPVQKENIWANKSSSSNMFVPSTTASNLQKPSTFTFGSATPFNGNNTTSAFGGGAQPTQNLFGMSNQNANSQPSMFSTAAPGQSTPNIFGSPQPASNPAPSIGLFGAPNVGATPTFGTQNPAIPAFETPSLAPASAPAFSFGSSQSAGIFGFGQHQQQSPQQPQSQQSGMYNFGAASSSAPQVQFNMGSAPNTAMRRVRKAVRRHPQR